jgi:hypothetical protein
MTRAGTRGVQSDGSIPPTARLAGHRAVRGIIWHALRAVWRSWRPPADGSHAERAKDRPGTGRTALSTADATLNPRAMSHSRHPGTRYELVGGGIGVGAAFGLILGLLLSGDTALFLVLGAAIGLGAGWIWDLDRH